MQVNAGHGSHARVDLVGIGRPKYVRKTYGPFNSELAAELADYLRLYKFLVAQHGIPVPRSVVRLSNAPLKARLVIENCEYIGPTLHDVIQEHAQPDGAIEDLLMQYLQIFARVRGRDYGISIDPPLSNFCIRDAQVVYCDNWPPRIRLPNDVLVEIGGLKVHNQYLAYRYFSDLQLRVIYAQMLRSLVTRPYFKPEVVQQMMCQAFGEDVRSCVLISDSERKYSLSSPSSCAADVLRIIASEAACSSKHTVRLDQVFCDTKIKPGGELPQESQLSRVCRLIRAHERLKSGPVVSMRNEAIEERAGALHIQRARQLHDYLASVKQSYGVVEIAGRLVEQGYLLVGTAQSEVWHVPGIPMTYRATCSQPGWYPRITDRNGMAHPLIIAHATPITAIWAALGGDINVQFQRQKLGLKLAPDDMPDRSGQIGWMYSKLVGDYRLHARLSLWEVVCQLDASRVLGFIDVVDNDGSFVVSVPGEPWHIGSPKPQRSIAAIPVRVSDVIAVSSAADCSIV